jgi:osmotically-inducible protein OsmY
METPGASREDLQSNELVRKRVIDALARQPWWRRAWSTVAVADGVVRLVGYVAAEWERPLARTVVERVQGVRAVVDDRARVPRWATLL